MIDPLPHWLERAPLAWRFRGRKRRAALDQIILHESVTTTTATAVRVLKRRRLSVHYTVAPDGTTLEHCPPAKRCTHAAGHNHRSIAVEVIGRCYPPKQLAAGREVIGARWMHKGRYLVPPGEQMRAVWRLVRYLCQRHDMAPDNFPGITTGGRFRWGRIANAKDPGIMAHARFQHSDGLYPEHYAVCRAGGMDHATALAYTLRHAASGQRVTDLPFGLTCEDWPAAITPAELELDA